MKTSVETGYSLGQGLAQTFGAAAALTAVYRYVLRSAAARASCHVSLLAQPCF